MRCWSLLIGARKIRATSARFSLADDRLIQEITARHFPAGFTILRSMGGWFDPARRRFLREESRQVLICGGTVHAVRRWATALGQALKQKEVIVVPLGKAQRWRMPRRD